MKFHTTSDPVEIHYTLINNVNDSDEELSELCSILKQFNICIKFIRFNPINDLIISTKEEKWIRRLEKDCPNLRIKVYSPPGREIGSSCGEFTKHYYHEEIETEQQYNDFIEWKQKHQIEQ